MELAGAVLDPAAELVADAGLDASVDASATEPGADTGPAADLNADATAGAGGEVEGDNRQIPPGLRASLDALKATDPKLATRIKTAWFAEIGFKKEFPGGMNEARALREFKERVGGDDGYQQIEAERQAYKDRDAQLVAGDAKILDHLATVAPEGLSKLIEPALKKLGETHPEQFQHLAARIALNSLPTELLGAIYTVLDANKTDPGIASLATKLAEWFNPLQQLAQKAPERKVEPERQKLEADRTKFENDKRADFQRGIVSEIEADGGKQADTIIDQLSGGKLSPEAKTRLKGVITSELDASLKADTAFIQKRDRLLAEGDRSKIVTNYKAEIAKRLPDIVKKVHREFYGAKPVAKVPTDIGTGRAAQTGKQPDASTIDWNRTSRRDVLDGKAYIKGLTAQVTW